MNFPWRRKKEAGHDDPLGPLIKFYEESKKEIAQSPKRTSAQIVVIRRDVDLTRPLYLAIGILILFVGVGLGWWARGTDVDRSVSSKTETEMTSQTKTETSVEKPRPVLKSSRADSIRHSSDSLRQKTRELLERIKKDQEQGR